MKRVIKFVALVIDVALMPIRALFSVQIAICGAIMADLSIKDTLVATLSYIKDYPSMFKDGVKIIFGED